MIGWEDERTVQYEGIATLLEEGSDELDRLKKAYFKKSPEVQNGKQQKATYTSKLSLAGFATPISTLTPGTLQYLMISINSGDHGKLRLSYD